MSDLGEAVIRGNLEAEAKKLEKLSDGMQEIVLKSRNISEEQKRALTKKAAIQQQAASDIRKVISTLS
jgi:ribosomal protein L22